MGQDKTLKTSPVALWSPAGRQLLCTTALHGRCLRMGPRDRALQFPAQGGTRGGPAQGPLMVTPCRDVPPCKGCWGKIVRKKPQTPQGVSFQHLPFLSKSPKHFFHGDIFSAQVTTRAPAQFHAEVPCEFTSGSLEKGAATMSPSPSKSPPRHKGVLENPSESVTFTLRDSGGKVVTEVFLLPRPPSI